MMSHAAVLTRSSRAACVVVLFRYAANILVKAGVLRHTQR